MLTIDDYVRGDYTGMTEQMLRNAMRTVERHNLLLAHYYQDNPAADKLVYSSGRRTPERNANTPGAAPKSKHLTCEAGDLKEHRTRRPFAKWCVNHLDLLDRVGLWMEDPRCTVGKWTSWVHLQTRPPRSGLRVFIPNAAWYQRLKGDSLDSGDL